MDSILCCSSNKGIVMLARNRQQAIYNINDTLIGVKDPDRDLSDLLRNAESYLKKNPVKDFIEDNCPDLSNLLIGSWGRRPAVLKSENRGGRFMTANALEYFSDMGSTIESRVSHAFESGLKLSYVKGMGDMLEFLYSISNDNDSCLQFGFIDKFGAKTLFHPDTDFSHPPSEYKKRGEIHKKRQETNDRFFDTLLKSLERTAGLKKRYPGFSYKSPLMGFRKRSLEKSIKKARQDTDNIISRYMDYSHGPVERFTIRSFLDDSGGDRLKKGLPVMGSLKRYSLQQRLDRTFLQQESGSILVSLVGKNYPKIVQDYQHALENELGAIIRPMINIPCISITGDTKDVNRLYSHLGKRRYSVFSRKASAILSSVARVERSHGVFHPELIQEFITGERYRVIPIMKYKKNALWNLENIGAIEANMVTTGRGVNVAVVDTGVDYDHQEISGNFDRNNLGIDIVGNTDDPMDRQGHGTHVAGTIAGESTGVAKDCRLYAVRVLNENGLGSLDQVMLGVDWCITNNIDIINLSLGSPSKSLIELQLFEKAYRNGVISVAAAGNSRYGPNYPASYESVIAVAAVDRYNEHPMFSNIYYTNNVSAPGVGIMSSLPGGRYGANTGTSMASPHIAGSCALIASVKDVNKDSVQKIIEDTAKVLGDPDDNGNWEKFGCGLVQVNKAVAAGGKRWRRSA